MFTDEHVEGRFNFDDVWIDGLNDLSHWEIPKVRFVEVRSTNKGWVYLSLDQKAFGGY